jgi:predicted AAA+ superfamily ATPase
VSFLASVGLAAGGPPGTGWRFGGGVAIMAAEMATLGRFFREPARHYFLFGPRGTGKSTLVRHAHPDALRIDLLAPEQHRAYLARPERLRDLVAGAPKAGVVVIDEVQRVPPLLDVVHELIESGIPQRFILTGSSARKLRRSGANLLAGRAIERWLHPFLAAELGERFDLDRALEFGLVPLVWSAEDPGAVRDTYLSLYVREEVQAEGMVRDLGGFARFLEAVSLSHGSVLNVSAVARECETSRKTVEGYLQILDDLLLSFTVPVFSRKAKRRLASHPKFYWFDTGVFRAARSAGPLDRPEGIAGAALEGLVAQHLRAWIHYRSSDCKLHFWRTKNGNEVDFVLYGNDCFQAIEVKNARRVHATDLGGLRAFVQDYPDAKPLLLYRGTERMVIQGVPCLPVDEFLRSLVPDQALPGLG